MYDFVFLNQHRQCFTGGALVFNRAENVRGRKCKGINCLKNLSLLFSYDDLYSLLYCFCCLTELELKASTNNPTSQM